MLRKLSRLVKFRTLVFSFLTPLFIFGFLGLSAAADFPTKAIQIFITYPPGGGADTFYRLIVNKLSALFGQSVVIVNKPGGGSMIGAYAAMSAPPDGYTVLSVTAPLILVPLTSKDINFNLMNEFTLTNFLADNPTIVVVKKESPWNTLEDLIAYAKKNPGKLSCSTSGPYGTPRFALELLKMYAGVDITHVPMDGTGPAVTAVLGGHTSMALPELGVVFKYLEAGSLKPLVAMSKTRQKAFPSIPTTAEKGFPKMISSSWQAAAVPKKTPQAVVDKLEKVFQDTLKDKEIIETLEKTGWVIGNLGTKETTGWMANFMKEMEEVARGAKILAK